jgi:endogenous inhibitor of DNA gyrase (YacG/DUF329 family)
MINYRGVNNPNYRGGRFFKCLECGKEFWVSPYRFNIAKYCSIKCRNIAIGRKHKGENNPAKRQEVKEKISKNNPMKNPVVRKIWEKKMKGENNPAKRPEIKAKIREKNLHILSRFWHGPNNPFYGKRHREDTLRKIREARMRQKIPKSLTVPEKLFMKLVEKYGLPFKYTGNGSFWVGYPPINPDFIGTDGKRVVVEILGEYWHTPKEFEERKKQYAKYGFKCIGIWGHELYECKEEELVRKIRCQIS